MGALDIDTKVSGKDGSYSAVLSPDWDFWVPNGGYLASVALRAAAHETPLPRPAAFYCHYLNPAQSGAAVELEVTTLRKSSRTHSMRIEMTEQGRPLLEALVWTIAHTGGPPHEHTTMPDVPPPSDLRSYDEIQAENPFPFPFWVNLESKPVTWTGRWEEHPVMHPLWRAWYRFRPEGDLTDPFVDAARSLILVDTLLYPAAALAHEGSAPFIAPSMDLAVRFHVPAPDSPWLLTSHEAPIGYEGLIGGYAGVWAEDGRLVATGGQQMLFRGAAPA